MAAEALSKRLPRGKYSAPPAPKDGAFFAPEIGLSPRIGPPHVPFEEARGRLGVTPAAHLGSHADGARVRIAGAAVVRQRPGTAKGFVFLSLEDETGLANAIVRPALFESARAVILHTPFLLVEGILQHQDGVIAVRATAVRPLPAGPAHVPSHDFH